MMSLWDALRMNMMISYQELVRTFPNTSINTNQYFRFIHHALHILILSKIPGCYQLVNSKQKVNVCGLLPKNKLSITSL
ncbi:hypothetical protein D9K42_16675 [Escherichia coli]|nr:hypothetical protein D9K42_16675 [Escherichia coli]